jgi:NADPH:quinone reductase-like Zn-dependent oxidoreductase
VSFVDASTLPISAATGYDGVEHLGLAAGDTLLIVGVGGGVGTAAAQVAISCGITVIGTAGPGKREFVEALGVTHVANGDGVADRIRAAAPDGIDGVYDLVGGPALDDVAEFAPPGKLITAGDPDTAAKYGGVPVQRDATGSTLVALATLVEQGSFKALVSQVLPFDEAATALDAVEQGHATGKVVIEIEGRGR